MNGDPMGGSGDYVGRVDIGKVALDGPVDLVIDEVVQ